MSQSSITVASAERKVTKTGKTYMGFTDSDGQLWSSWESQVWPNIKAGAQFDIEWEQSGKFRNIHSMRFTGDVEPPPPPEPVINQQKQQSIERQHAITKVVDLYIAGKLADDNPIVEAAMRYLTQQVMGAGNAAVQKVMESPMVAAAKGMGAKESGRDAAGKVAAGIKTLGALRQALAKLGCETEAEQLSAIAAESFAEVTDFSGAYIFAWEQKHG